MYSLRLFGRTPLSAPGVFTLRANEITDLEEVVAVLTVIVYGTFLLIYSNKHH